MTTKLSPAMRAAMGKLSRPNWRGGLSISISTLRALQVRDLVESKGADRHPWTWWRLTYKGERRRKAEAVIELVRRA